MVKIHRELNSVSQPFVDKIKHFALKCHILWFCEEKQTKSHKKLELPIGKGYAAKVCLLAFW